MASTQPRLAARLLLAASGLLLAAAAVEVVLRVAGVGGPLPLEPLFDREVIEYLPQENAMSVAKWKRRRLKVAVVGDSFTHGDGVSWDDTYAERLSRLLNLNTAAPAAQVRVWARNGSNTQDELRFLEAALRWKADLLILGVFLNDSEDPAEPVHRELRTAMLPRVPTGWARAVLRRSRALTWVYERADEARRNRASGAYSDLVFDPAYPGWQAFESALDTFVRRTREERVRFVAVLFPHLDGVGPRYDPTGHDRMLAALTDRSIDTLALRPLFLDKAPVRMTVYPGVDGHPTEIAHRLAARALFEFLLVGGHIDSVYRPRRVQELRSRDEWLRQLRRYRDTVHFPP